MSSMIECKKCFQKFEFTEREKNWYAEMGFKDPKKCKRCKDIEKNKKTYSYTPSKAELQRKEALTQKELVQQLYVKSELRSKAIREITATFEGLQKSLYETLADEFRDDLPRWNATLEKDSTIRFNEPDVLFKTGEAELQEKFIVILNDFFL